MICQNQEEVDYYWEKLAEDGNESAQQCGWLKDKFGVSWQIVPDILPEMLADPDLEKSQRDMTSMLGKKKLDIKRLHRPYPG